MTTMTDDIGPRLAAVEAHISNINTQLAEINANQRQLREEMQAMRAEHQAEMQAMRQEFQAEMQAMREEFQAENRSMRSEHQADTRTLHERIDQTNGRIDQTNAKIDRLLYVALGGFITLAVGMALLYLRIGP